MQEKVLSASRLSLEGRNMAPNSPALLIRKNIHDMHKLAVDVKFTQMAAKKGIKKHGEILVASTYK